MLNWFVYFLKSSKKGWIYVGSTNQVQRRFKEHCDGLVQSTKFFRPLKLAAYVAVDSEEKARKLEKYFKTGSGKAVLRKRILTDEAPTGA
ncbi:MAG: GIY-YIG nuclease family protein [Bacteroidota bacterium]|nr:GIY-YIG nuclease family protein [Bacteroidota bacterium]